jgi:hypothetical protein
MFEPNQAIAFQQTLDLRLDRHAFFGRIQAGSNELPVVASLNVRNPHARKRIAGQDVATEQLQNLVGILLVGLPLPVLRRAGNLRRCQHMTLEVGRRQLVVQSKALARRLIGKERSRSCSISRVRPADVLRTDTFSAASRPRAIFNNIVLSCKSQATMINSDMASAPVLGLKQANPERFCGRFFKVCDGATRAGRRFLGVCEWGVVLSDRVLVVVFLR